MAISYLDAPFAYKLKKVTRYISLYGVARTLVKIRGQFHMQRRFAMQGDAWSNPQCRDPQHNDRFVAIIGCGNFGYSGISFFLAGRSRRFLRATLDIEPSRAISLCRDYGGAHSVTL